MRTLRATAALLMMLSTVYAQENERMKAEQALSALEAFIQTPVMDYDDARTLLKDAGFINSGWDVSETWLWRHPALGSQGTLAFDEVLDDLESETVSGPAWYWRLGFRGISLNTSEDRSILGLSALALPSRFLPEIMRQLLDAGFHVDSTTTYESNEFDDDGRQRTVMNMTLTRASDTDEYRIMQVDDFVVFKLFLGD